MDNQRVGVSVTAAPRATRALQAFLADLRGTVLPDRTGRNGPLPPLLISMTVVTGIIDAFSYLDLGHVFVAYSTGNVVFLGFALAGVPGFSIAACLAGMAAPLAGALLGGRLAARYRGDRALALPDLNTTVLTLTFIGIAADSALAGGSGSRAGRRLVPIAAVLGGAVLGATLIRHAQAYDPLVIALAIIATGAAVSYLLGRSDPPWARTQRSRSPSTVRYRRR